MMTKERPTMLKKAFTMPPEVLEILQELADARFDGNVSMAIRHLVREWDESRKGTANQNGGK